LRGVVLKIFNKRKRLTEKRLKTLAIPINLNLPLIDEEEVQLRTKEEVIDRLIALTIVSAKAMDAPKEKLNKFISNFDAMNLFTKQEKAYIINEDLKPEESFPYSWKIECAWVLFWSLNMIPELDDGQNECDVNFIFETVLRSTREELINKATLREKDLILDNLDYIYRAHWAIRDAQINNKKIPAGLNQGVIYERHYSLNWLTNYMDQKWDEVSTDT